MRTQPSLWTIILTCLLRAPRKWRGEEQEKAEPALRKSCRSPRSSPESTRKNLTRNMESNRRKLTNSNSTVSFLLPPHNWLYIGSDWEMIWSTTQRARMPFCTTILPLCSLWFRCVLKTSMEVTYSHTPPKGSFWVGLWQPWRQCLALTFSFWKRPTSLGLFPSEGEPSERSSSQWMCSALSWNHKEWARVHEKPVFCFPYYENGTYVVLHIFITIMKKQK